MKNSIKFTVLVLFISFQACITTKGKDTTEGKDLSTTEDIINMKEKGFIKGTLSTSKSEGCPYILSVEKYEDKLDPINIQDFFKHEMPEKVWVKYSNLRMQNRCSEARPISIQEISKRTD
ncbi:hypothetical protein [Aquimarina sp. SS2-1]|uniref:hypothetical protein n=1 Tax=Aquimarina besae TaxID=3342247 RepID=UPI00366E2BCD